MMYVSREYMDHLPYVHESMGSLDVNNVPADPNRLFASWFDEAAQRGVGNVRAATVATVDEDGMPDARIMDLMYLDSDGFHFGTGAESAKVRQLESTLVGALNFWWQPIGRAVRVRGHAKRVVEGERFNLWCVMPKTFEFFHFTDRWEAERIAFKLDDEGSWRREWFL
ncbi:pyridoxamine 5'-phosphate oxidase family protein [Corynebacterium sp. Marseille-P4321]|uniref:pyridoxamine 5'-phosphate oxidase family protein n=1 Tax=Corynebacterium sp. Marseille-P4321 TaxID=2736603 RepID=UPI000892C980|nr:pyridoxamine 5'-phosphate oxidase family protein [Corynebacterium sp. Marseille-P4321]OEY13495.1 hypothetical protein A0K93_04955 [Corynebacterium sp. BCW_4722]